MSQCRNFYELLTSIQFKVHFFCYLFKLFFLKALFFNNINEFAIEYKTLFKHKNFKKNNILFEKIKMSDFEGLNESEIQVFAIIYIYIYYV